MKKFLENYADDLGFVFIRLKGQKDWRGTVLESVQKHLQAYWSYKEGLKMTKEIKVTDGMSLVAVPSAKNLVLSSNAIISNDTIACKGVALNRIVKNYLNGLPRWSA